jgi:hypothetical protein
VEDSVELSGCHEGDLGAESKSFTPRERALNAAFSWRYVSVTRVTTSEIGFDFQPPIPTPFMEG